MHLLISQWLEASLPSASCIDAGTYYDGGSSSFLFINSAGQRLGFFFEHDFSRTVQNLQLLYVGPEGKAVESIPLGSADEAAVFRFLEGYIEKLCGPGKFETLREWSRLAKDQRLGPWNLEDRMAMALLEEMDHLRATAARQRYYR